MSLDERYRILFEPLKIGPVTAPNRFYQVPTVTAWAIVTFLEWLPCGPLRQRAAGGLYVQSKLKYITHPK
ncbi:MAG: hypothetical protein Ct9H300mP28_34280 [Pseudomonadota bacterium]|nr:MAG: hypothetical protein Ct9H300mP28_34280 [Pseudomonadota bacterium]